MNITKNKKQRWITLFVLIGVIFAVMTPSTAAYADTSSETPVAEVDISTTEIVFRLEEVDHAGLTLTVSGPGNVRFNQEYAAGENPTFGLFDGEELLPDGSYTYELVVLPNSEFSVRPEDSVGLDTRDSSEPYDTLVQFGYFTILDGAFVLPGFEIEPEADFASRAPDDFVINDDLIVTFSACIGNDCVDGEVFGFDTLRLKENNTRIKFLDTSTAASFPSNDWQLTANDSSNGGANKFSIDDITGGRTPFTVEAGAPSHSLYVDDGGRLGLGTSQPVVEIHLVDGDTPTVRLAQDGSSGFTSYIWDMAGNEAGFFIRDASNGSTLPFRIRPGAPTASIFIEGTGDIGLGTTTPDFSLEVEEATNDATIAATNTGNSTNAQMLAGVNPEFKFSNASGTWSFLMKSASGRLNITDDVDPYTRVPLKIGDGADNNLMKIGIPANTVQITGDLVVTGQCTEVDGDCAPDYVFAPDYNMLSLVELEQYIAKNQHLPNVPSGAELDANGINVQDFSYTLLEKVEELTLYTLEQEQTIIEQGQTIEDLGARLDAQAPAQVSITALLPWLLLTVALVALTWTYGKRQAQENK